MDQSTKSLLDARYALNRAIHAERTRARRDDVKRLGTLAYEAGLAHIDEDLLDEAFTLLAALHAKNRLAEWLRLQASEVEPETDEGPLSAEDSKALAAANGFPRSDFVTSPS